MFAYCDNNSVNCFDSLGSDAIWIQEKNSAAGFGHSGLMVQDADGTWYYFYWGPEREDIQLGILFAGVKNRIVVDKMASSGADLSTVSGVRACMLKSDNSFISNRTSKVSSVYYFSGDYTATLATIQEWKEEKDYYQLIADNCVQRCVEAMSKSNPAFKHLLSCLIPNLISPSILWLSDQAPSKTWTSVSRTHSYRMTE